MKQRFFFLILFTFLKYQITQTFNFFDLNSKSFKVLAQKLEIEKKKKINK